MSSYVSESGAIVSGDPKYVGIFRQIELESIKENHKWVSKLRALGVKAAHPNDGWVDRENCTVQLVYPQFDDGAAVGDLIALGWHFESEKAKLVRAGGRAQDRLYVIGI